MLCDWGCSGVWDKGMLMLCRLGVLIMYKDVCDIIRYIYRCDNYVCPCGIIMWWSLLWYTVSPSVVVLCDVNWGVHIMAAGFYNYCLNLILYSPSNSLLLLREPESQCEWVWWPSVLLPPLLCWDTTTQTLPSTHQPPSWRHCTAVELCVIAVLTKCSLVHPLQFQSPA